MKNDEAVETHRRDSIWHWLVRRSISESRAVTAFVILFFVILLGWVYSPVITEKYGCYDDYHILKRVAEKSFQIGNSEYGTGGRPLMGLGTKILFSIPRSVDTLGRARIVSVLGIIAFAFSAFHVLRTNGFSLSLSISAALLMCLTPGFTVYAGWLTDGVNSYAAAIALLAGNLFGLGVECSIRSDRMRFFCLGVLLQLAAYLTYQSVAAFAVLALLIRAMRGLGIDGPGARRFAMGVFAAVSVMVVYFVGYKIVSSMFHFGGQAARAGLTKKPLDNLHFVMTDVLWSGVTSWAQFHGTLTQRITACLVSGIIVLGCCIRPWKKNSMFWWTLACVLVTFIMSVLPLLILEEHYFVFRSQTVLHAMMVFLLLIALERGMTCMLPPAARQWVAVVLLGGVLSLGACVTRFHLSRDFVAPSVREAAILTDGIKKLNAFPEKIVYITPAYWIPHPHSEFGAPSSPLCWSTGPMLELLMIQVFEPKANLRKALRRHANFTAQYGPANNPEIPTLDGFTLLNGPSTKIQDAYWGNLRTNQFGWCVSDWFGVFNNENFPLIWHCHLGWLLCSGTGIDNFSFKSDEFGLFSTSPKTFPSLNFKDHGVSYYLSPDIKWPCCSFQNEKTHEWTLTP